jgi:pyruvate dehydrogenase E1 component alpha subunit
MHIADFEKGMLGANGIVAGGISIVTGAALAAKLDGKGGVAVSFFGDGASAAGPLHECMNIAAAWKLPILYVCENNGYAAQTSAKTTIAHDGEIVHRAAGYGIPGVQIDGNDIFAVYDAAEKAVARARAGEGPTLIEARTYRWRAHTERKGQPDYRPVEDIEAWKAPERDPIARLVARLKQEHGFTDADWQELDRQVLARIEQSCRFAEASPFPTPDEALDDVFAA